MLKKGLAVLAVALFAAPLFADIELSTSINDVFHQGTNELAGSITMRVNDNDFDDASTSEPVFIRIRLDNNGRLAETLVDQSLDSNGTTLDDYLALPIFLAMTLNINNLQGQVLTAPDETVSIVRWVEDEDELWIRIQASSSNWIEDSGTALPPTTNLTVSWSFGTSARVSHDQLENKSINLRNLPFNTRYLDTIGEDEDAVSTLICVNLLGSDLEIDELLEYDAISFDYTAEQDADNGIYGNGRVRGSNFTNDFRIARGKARLCTVRIADKGGFAVEDLCVPRAASNGDIDGFIWAINSIDYIIDCEDTGDYLPSPLLNGAYWAFSTGSRAPYGFSGLLPPYFNTVNGGAAYFPAAARFNNRGANFYSTVILFWNDGLRDTTNYRVSVTVPVRYHYLDGPTAIDLDWEIVLVNNDSALDDAPFDGIDQPAFCQPSEFSIGEGTWNFGAFVACVGAPSTLFFPYMPKLKDDALFWSGLSLVNQGVADLDVSANIYNENGELYTAEFPELDSRNQYTWLLIDDVENGVTGFFGMGDHEDTVIVPEPASEENGEFGMTRMSMFVNGTYEATFTDERAIGDLDGYLLIGKGGDIDGSYLPRNYDNGTNQDADLPLFRSKNGKQIRVDRVNSTVISRMGESRPALINNK
jgi:hypothetical protein